MNQYPLWRYLLIIVISVLGFIYAAPNLFGEDPAIQISAKNAPSIPQEASKKIAASLQNIPYASIKQEGDNRLLIRFRNIEDQLRAQDYIQAALGDDYSVALNLAPKTPRWLQALGAQPMKLGLDLRGGIHFLLEVNTDAMLKQRFTSDLTAMATQLRSEMIRYTGVAQTSPTSITVSFRDANARDQGLIYLKKNFPDYQYTSADNNNYTVTASLTPQAFINLEQDAVNQNITILRNRVNELGVAEPVIQQQGKNKISVDLPGIQDTARAKEMIGKVATIRLQLVDTEHDATEAERTGIIPPGTTLYQFEGRPVLLKNQAILMGTSILNASTISGEDGRPAVAIRAGGSGVNYFHRITSENIGKPLATVYVETQTVKQNIGGKIVSSQKQVEKVINIANIQSALGNQFQVSGLESMSYAQNLALLLRSGAYSAPVSFIQEKLVGPSLGKENIRTGVISTIVSAILVMLFMALYYQIFGVIADIALIMNLVLLIAVMSILGFTLTLPGIAGIVLTLGMAVDANVLINERIREELRNGLTPQASIYAGYERAFATIVDSNVTTLIVAVILFAIGSGPVQGFAITLTIGLLISMVTAIFFTRAIVNLMFGRRRVTKLPIGIKLPSQKSQTTTVRMTGIG